MLLSRAGRLSPRLCSSYIEISNYVRGRQAGLRTGVYSSAMARKPFHTRSPLLGEAEARLEPRQFLEQYKASGMVPSSRLVTLIANPDTF